MFKKFIKLALAITVINILLSAYNAVFSSHSTNQTIETDSNQISSETPSAGILNWKELGNAFQVAPAVEIPPRYKLSAAFDDYIQISRRHSSSDKAMTETEMNNFIVSNYLPSDCIITYTENYFEERHRSNGTSFQVSKYTLKSPYYNKQFFIQYKYAYGHRNHIMDSDYRYVIIEK